MPYSTKVDPLINELVNSITKGDASVRQGTMAALASVLRFAGAKASAAMHEKAGDLLFDLLSDDKADVRTTAAGKHHTVYSCGLTLFVFLSLLSFFLSAFVSRPFSRSIVFRLLLSLLLSLLRSSFLSFFFLPLFILVSLPLVRVLL